MDELVVNPDGCRGFEPNQFKKEKCKHCGRQWTEHKGAISEEQVQTFVKHKQKIIDDQKQKEADAKEKARAKALAKKMQTQAAEDKWLFDGAQEVDSTQDSDDDAGFSMFVPELLPDRPKIENKPLKVKNLIDFSECDLASEDHAADTVASRPVVEQDMLQQEAPLPGCPTAGGMPFAREGSTVQPAVSGGAHSLLTAQPPYQERALQEELLTEIEHLRQMLADANEEKSIQVAIVRDEVIEKQQLLDDIKRQHLETEVQLREAHDRVAALEARAAQVALERDEAWALAEQRRAQAELHSAEAQDVRAQVEQLRAELDQLQVASATQIQAPPSVAETMTELHDLCSRTQEVLGTNGQLPERALTPRAAAKDAADANGLEAGLRDLLAEVRAVHAAAQHASADRRQQAVKLRDLEKASLTKRGIYSEPTPVRNGIATSEEHAQDLGRQAAQALKEMRLNAEQQLAWINKRMRMSRQATGCIDSPVDRRQGAAMVSTRTL